MRISLVLLIPFLTLLLVWSPGLLYGAPQLTVSKQEGPVNIEADELLYDREAQFYEAHGKVEVTRGDLFLRADHAHLDMRTRDLAAWGNVLLREGEDVLESERLEVNLNTRLGKIYNARIFLKDQNFHITGREVEKLGEARYRITDGSFTTCNAKRPPWKFTVKELDVTLEGFGIAKGPVFHISDIPLLYFPIAVFPVKRERQTGFLLPDPGYSSKNGPEVKNAFFWAISKEMDATFYLDWLGERGFKEGVEYRYALTPDTFGQANFYFTDDQSFKEERYAFFFRHHQRFPNDLYLKADLNHVSDPEYVVDFDDDLPYEAKIDSRSRRQLRSVLFGGKNWDRFSFLTQGTAFNDLTKESNDETVQILPQASFNAHPQSLFGTPLFYDVASSYSHFWREKGLEAHRGDLFPRISYPTRLFNVLKLESSIGLRETLYRTSSDPVNDRWESRETVDAGVEMGTEFYKTYDSAMMSPLSRLFQVDKWMHTVEPVVSYRYIPRVDQRDVPLFDEVDRIPYTNQITYGFTQRLIGKLAGARAYEYAKFNIFQSYSLGDPFLDVTGRERRLSNIQAEMWWNFGPYVSALGDAKFNPYESRFDELNGAVVFRDRRDDALMIQYRNTRDSIRQLNLDARIRTIPPLQLYGGIRYNLLEKIMIESIYGAEYQAQCWAVGLVIEDKNRSPDRTRERELEFHIYFNLLGFGTIGRKPYHLMLM
jgi:LPS-assembly protein